MCPPKEMIASKIEKFKQNVYERAELVLQETLVLCEMIESGDHNRIVEIVHQDKSWHQLKKESDLISVSAIVEAVERQGKNEVGAKGMDYFHSEGSLCFVLTGIRIMIYLEKIRENTRELSQIYANFRFHTLQVLGEYELLNRTLTRMATVVGIVVESLVEEKDRFFGSTREVCEELKLDCLRLSQLFVKDESFTRDQLEALFLLITKIKETGTLTIDIAEELLQLSKVMRKRDELS